MTYVGEDGVDSGTDVRLHETLADKLFSTYRNVRDKARATSTHSTPRLLACLQWGPVVDGLEGGDPSCTCLANHTVTHRGKLYKWVPHSSPFPGHGTTQQKASLALPRVRQGFLGQHQKLLLLDPVSTGSPQAHSVCSGGRLLYPAHLLPSCWHGFSCGVLNRCSKIRQVRRAPGSESCSLQATESKGINGDFTGAELTSTVQPLALTSALEWPALCLKEGGGHIAINMQISNPISTGSPGLNCYMTFNVF